MRNRHTIFDTCHTILYFHQQLCMSFMTVKLLPLVESLQMALELLLTPCHHKWLTEELLQCQRHKSHLFLTSVILHSFNYLFTHSFTQHYLLSAYNLLCTNSKIRSEKCTQSLPLWDIKHMDSVTYSISTSRWSTLCCSRHLIIVNNSPGSVVFTCKLTLSEPTPCHLLCQALTHRRTAFMPPGEVPDNWG